jgi:hypothetical protein
MAKDTETAVINIVYCCNYYNYCYYSKVNNK